MASELLHNDRLDTALPRKYNYVLYCFDKDGSGTVGYGFGTVKGLIQLRDHEIDIGVRGPFYEVQPDGANVDHSIMVHLNQMVVLLDKI